MIETDNIKETTILCYHCGDICKNTDIGIGDKIFCCSGCKTVYEMLSGNDLCSYYAYNERPGFAPSKDVLPHRFEFLDDPDTRKKLVNFTDGYITTVTFFIPRMHCSSCIWLLENLYRFNPGIVTSRVDFLRKELSVKFLDEKVSLRKVVELLDSIGYTPEINLGDLENKASQRESRSLYYRIGLAGFCFANIMLLSFPEYLSIVNSVDDNIRRVFGYIIILLSLPVFFYCSSIYFTSAFSALKKKIINIDFPISLGIIVLFGRSVYDILSGAGPGFMDSLAGLLFFLLLGRLFQNKTYETLNFDRNYLSYFPVAVTVKKDGKETTVPASKLNQGDRIIIRNSELVPADSVLISGSGHINYSFVTGESRPVEKQSGDMIYAGGRQEGTAIELEVIKEVSQSYITQLWNDNAFSKDTKNRINEFTNIVSRYFTFAVLIIAFLSAGYRAVYDMAAAFNVFTAVLIVACPCALALSAPFTFGSTLRIFGKNRFYLKNNSVIERLASVDSIVFDKTGTITRADHAVLEFKGEELAADDIKAVRSLVRNSTHPLSRSIYEYLNSDTISAAEEFTEIPGVGVQAVVEGRPVRLGSMAFTGAEIESDQNSIKKTGKEKKYFDTTVYLSIDDRYRGYFKVNNSYRDGLKEVIDSVTGYDLTVLSGDNDGEKKNLESIFPEHAGLHFRQSPQDKLDYIKKIQENNRKVLMIGDGLNDAGALRQSDVGISVSDNVANFSPACDAILDSSVFDRLGTFIRFSKDSMYVIYFNLVISLIYNLAGLSFATRGMLSPLIAAILMPLSSVTVVLSSTVLTNLLARKKRLL